MIQLQLLRRQGTMSKPLFQTSQKEGFGVHRLQASDTRYREFSKNNYGETEATLAEKLSGLKAKLEKDFPEMVEDGRSFSNKLWDDYLTMFLRVNSFKVQGTTNHQWELPISIFNNIQDFPVKIELLISI